MTIKTWQERMPAPRLPYDRFDPFLTFTSIDTRALRFRDAEIADLRTRVAELELLHANGRWNVESTDSGLRVCKGEHERSAKCDWCTYVPEDRAYSAEKRVAELEAKIEAHNARWIEYRADCHQAAGGDDEHGPDDECELCAGIKPGDILIDTEASNG